MSKNSKIIVGVVVALAACGLLAGAVVFLSILGMGASFLMRTH